MTNDVNELRDALESMCWQFAFRSQYRGRLALNTGGMSALEAAFEALNWSDPFTEFDSKSLICAVKNCKEWKASGLKWEGMYLGLCSAHTQDCIKGYPRPALRKGLIQVTTHLSVVAGLGTGVGPEATPEGER